MSGLDKIIEHITQEAAQEAQQIQASAAEEADRLLAAGKEEADKQAASIRKQSDLDVAAAAKRVASLSELREKRIVLKAKQDMIEGVFEEALSKLHTQDDATYFETIRKMISRYATGEKGEILFSAGDLARLPEDLSQEVAAHGLSISETPAEITGGFILSYGDIDENCSFESLIDASREKLMDQISGMLFG